MVGGLRLVGRLRRVSGLRGIGGVGSVGGFRLVLSVAVDYFNTHLLRQGDLDLLALGGAQLGRALLDGLHVLLHFGLVHALLLRHGVAAETGQGDGLVDTGLDGLRIANPDGHVDGLHHGNVVSSLLLDLLAVLVSVGIAVAVGRLAHGHHLLVGLLLEVDLHCLGGGFLVLLVVVVGADFVVDGLTGLGADGA